MNVIDLLPCFKENILLCSEKGIGNIYPMTMKPTGH